MATGVEELVDMLFDMIDEAKNAPLSSEKCIIERDKALDLLDDIKAQFPVELAEARKILNARNEYVAAAKREADEIRKRAEIEAGQMVSEDRVMNQARQKANELVAQAEVKAKEVRRAANEYCEDVLRPKQRAVGGPDGQLHHAAVLFFYGEGHKGVCLLREVPIQLADLLLGIFLDGVVQRNFLTGKCELHVACSFPSVLCKKGEGSGRGFPLSLWALYHVAYCLKRCFAYFCG